MQVRRRRRHPPRALHHVERDIAQDEARAIRLFFNQRLQHLNLEIGRAHV